ncbi:MAG: DUF975 family protein [Candidatus Buchananbacteria bacterium]|nr:DUF975 family protein [Candidatus Buchananbacteria bacterium]
MNKFSIGEVIRLGWETFKKNALLAIGILIGLVVINSVISGITGAFDKSNFVVILVINILSLVVSTWLSVVMYRLIIKITDGKAVSTEDLKTEPMLLVRFFAAQLVAGILIVIGFVLLIVPGVYLALRFMFAPYAIVDKNLGPIEALKYSGELTKGIKWQLLGYSIVAILIILLGAIALLVGLLVAVPVVMFASVHIYRKLQGQATVVSVTPTAPTPAPTV